MNENVYDVTLPQILDILKKRWWIIALTAIICAIIAFGYTHLFVTPTYTTYGRLEVKRYDMTTYQDAIAGQQMAKDDAAFLRSNKTMKIAAEELNSLDYAENGGQPYRVYTSDVLMGMVGTSADEGSRYFTVTVTSTNPKEAKIVADAVIKAFSKRLVDTYKIYNDDGTAEVAAECIVNHEPEAPTAPSGPNKIKNAIIGGAVGLVVTLVVVILFGLLRDVLNSEEWLIKAYGERFPVLAVIPDTSSKGYGYSKYASKYGYEQKKQQ